MHDIEEVLDYHSSPAVGSVWYTERGQLGGESNEKCPLASDTHLLHPSIEMSQGNTGLTLSGERIATGGDIDSIKIPVTEDRSGPIFLCNPTQLHVLASHWLETTGPLSTVPFPHLALHRYSDPSSNCLF